MSLGKSGFVLAVGLSLSALSGSAEAALTDSEQAQVRGFVRAGAADKAGRVRALVGRPDLSSKEAAEPLVAGFRGVEFDKRRTAFARALLYGPGSRASRNDLVAPVVDALLARAAQVLGRLPAAASQLERPPARRQLRELRRIYSFITREIANAGTPPLGGHDAGAAIRDDALKAAVQRLRAHLQDQGAWLKHGRKVEAPVLGVRAQAQVALVELARGLFGAHELSEPLGLRGVRRSLFERHGVLLEEGGRAGAEDLKQIARLLETTAVGPGGPLLWVLSKQPTSGLEALGGVARAGVSFRVPPGAARGVPASLLGAEVDTIPVDGLLSEVAWVAALPAARVALRRAPALRARTKRAVEAATLAGVAAYLAGDLPRSVLGRAEGAGVPGLSPELLLTHTIRALLIDGRRALELAIVRAAAGRPEPLEQLVLGLSVLTKSDTAKPRTELRLGHTYAPGQLQSFSVEKIRAENGVVAGFELAGAKYQFVRGPEGTTTAVTVDGAAPKIASLTHARHEARAEARWQLGLLTFDRLHGAPRGVVIDDSRLLLVAAKKSHGFDAVAFGPPPSRARRLRLRSKLRVTGAGGGILLGARPGKRSFSAIALLIAADPPVAHLVRIGSDARATELKPKVTLPPMPAGGYDLVVDVDVDKLTVKVGEWQMSTKLTPTPIGRLGLTVRPGGTLSLEQPRVTSGRKR